MPRIHHITGRIAEHRRDWFDEERTVLQDCSSGVCGIYLSDGTPIAPGRAAGVVVGRNGKWAAGAWIERGAPGVAPYKGVFAWDGEYPEAGLSVEGAGPFGEYALKLRHHSYGPWDVIEPDGGRWRLTDGDASNIQLLGRRRAVWMEGQELKTTPGLPIEQPAEEFWGFKTTEVGGVFVCLYQSKVDGTLVLSNRRILPASDSYHYADVAFIGGLYIVTWSPNTADVNAQVRTFTPQELLAFPKVGEVPVATPIQLAKFPRKMWVFPFYSHDERFGDTAPERHVGNGILLVEREGDPLVIHRELNRVRPLGKPMMVEGVQKIAEENLNTTVAWWAKGGTVEQLAVATRVALRLPEKMVVSYLDNDDWPASRPDWITSRVCPAPQAYRRNGESLDAFRLRIEDVLRRVSAYGREMFLTPRFDDPDQTEDRWSLKDTLDCMPLYEKWIREFNIVGFMPFADRRGSGIAKHDILWQWAKAFLDANPAMPGRFDYWTSVDVAPIEVLRNKLGQDTVMTFLTRKEKDYLLQRLQDGPPDPDPTDPPPTEFKYANYEEHMKRRWNELGMPARTAETQASFGGLTQDQMNDMWHAGGDQRARCEEIMRVYEAFQLPAFFKILGELYHDFGHRDVGAGRKPGGTNWNGMAIDIVVLKPIDARGNVIADQPVQMIDAGVAFKGPSARIGWNIGEPNEERTWVEPPRP